MTRRIRPDAAIAIAAIVAGAAYLTPVPAPRSAAIPDVLASVIPAAPADQSTQSLVDRGEETGTQTGASLDHGSLPSGAPAVASIEPSDQRPSSGVEGAPAPLAPSPTPRPSRRPATKPPATVVPSRAASSQSLRVPTNRATRMVSGGLRGTASWYCLVGRSACTRGYAASGLYAAAGPAIRAALGDWRGRYVTVAAQGTRAAVVIQLIDWCSCPNGRVLDLYASVWQGLGVPLSAGLVDVEVSW